MPASALNGDDSWLLSQLGPIPAGAGEPVCCATLPGIAMAYPRRSGGTVWYKFESRSLSGLSPQERGNRWWSVSFRTPPRPIPAGAGEPPSPSRAHPAKGAYPRRSGGTRQSSFSRFPSSGLSPQERGNLPDPLVTPVRVRPIPAGAGEPYSAQNPFLAHRAYPRRSGGTGVRLYVVVIVWGLSPQERGNRYARR